MICLIVALWLAVTFLYNPKPFASLNVERCPQTGPISDNNVKIKCRYRFEISNGNGSYDIENKFLCPGTGINTDSAGVEVA